MLSSLFSDDILIPLVTFLIISGLILIHTYLRIFVHPGNTHFKVRRETLHSPWASRFLSRYQTSRKNLSDRWPSITNLDPFKKASTMVQGDLAVRPEALEMPCVLHHMVYTASNRDTVGQMTFTPSVKRGDRVAKGQLLGELRLHYDDKERRPLSVVSPMDAHVFDFIENISDATLGGEVVTLLEKGKEMTALCTINEYELARRELEVIKRKAPAEAYPPGRIICITDDIDPKTIKIMASPLHTEKDKVAWIFRTGDDAVSAAIKSGGMCFFILLEKMCEPRPAAPASGLIRSNGDGSYLGLSINQNEATLALTSGTQLKPLKIMLEGPQYSQEGIYVIDNSQVFRLIDTGASDEDLDRHQLLPCGKDLC